MAEDDIDLGEARPVVVPREWVESFQSITIVAQSDESFEWMH